MNDFFVQTLKRNFRNDLERAEKYYALLSVWNNLKLTKREIQLLAFTATDGNISYTSSKEEFSRLYGSSPATVNNMISKLKGIGLLVKSVGKYKVTPIINLDFSREIVIGFKLLNLPGGENV